MTDHSTAFPESKAQAFFSSMLTFRWPIVLLGLLFIVLAGSFLPSMVKDTSSDSFIDPNEPYLQYRQKIQDIFGLADPMVIAVINEGDQGIYNKDSLALVQWLTDNIQKLDNIDPDKVVSLATESNIVGTFDGMEVEDFFEDAPDTDERISWIKEAIGQFPLYQGSLVARNGQATIIVTELIDERKAPDTYKAVLEMLKQAPGYVRQDKIGQDEVHVAGEGAVSGYMSAYIDNDVQRLTPLSGLIISLVLLIAFMTPRAIMLPNIIVLATAAGTFGIMAAVGVSFYVITNGLIVCLIGIAVADSLHIFSQYYDEMAERPEASQNELVVRAVAAMWRPVTLTTVTTMAGFLALWPTNDMPPVQYFGLFGALGVFIAWTFSLTFLPSLLSLLPKRQSRAFKTTTPKGSVTSRSARIMRTLGRGVLRNPKKVLAISMLVVIAGAYGSSLIIIEDTRIDNFKTTEPLYIADKRINDLIDGTYYLDIMIETPAPDDLYKSANLKKIAALQNFLESQPGIAGSTSIADYIKQMHKAVNENDQAFYSIPESDLLIAQLFLLYSASGEPTDFEEEIDGDRQLALVRANLKEGSYVRNGVIIKATEAYIANHFNSADITATVTGRVNVDYHWIKGIKDSHLASVLVAFTAVILMAAFLFRSLWAGLFAAIPVGMSILMIYAVMGYGNIWLGVGTSMFASIAIGLGVDFAIHTIDRMKELLAEKTGNIEERLIELFPSTGRALFFNFAAISLGFSALISSDVPPLINFGALVAIAIATSFVASMTVLPALVVVLGPDFLVRKSEVGKLTPASATALVAAAIIGIAGFMADEAHAADLPEGVQIAKNLIAPR